MRLTCFGRAMQNGGTFHSFFEEEIGKLLAKNSKIIIVEVGYPKNWKKNGSRVTTITITNYIYTCRLPQARLLNTWLSAECTET